MSNTAVWQIQPYLGTTRRLSTAAGVASLLALGIVPEGEWSDRLAFAAFVALALAVVLGWLQFGIEGRDTTPNSEAKQGSRVWLAVTVGIALLAVLAMQTWFRPGTAIGLGDTVLPSGTAWVGRLFEPWTWSGFNMGEPSQLPLMLPWAAVVEAVHVLGGDPGAAQRIWYTTLFVLAALAALGLMASLRMGPFAASIGAAVYVLNPYVASQVNINPVFLAALFPLVAIPAALVAAGTGRLRIRWSALICAATAPVLGYVFFNPPLIGLILGAALGTPLLVAWVDGREAALRSVRALVASLALLLVLSAYWIAPALLHLSGFVSNQLASVSSWSFTEVRASIRNAFWLNTVWGWRFSEFYPFAAAYEKWPLSVLRFALPAIAFGSLALDSAPQKGRLAANRNHRLRLAIAIATVALFLILLSNGNNSPGNVIFNPLYSLPFGWLLREPGRFLMLAAASYAVLVAIAVDVATEQQSLSRLIRLKRLPPLSPRLSIVPVALLTALAVGFPIYTGAEIPDTRPGMPTGHVTMPSYWPAMARYVDALPVEGSVLIMPPDDFYGMPYSWGYYGADSFIPDLFTRPVLVPNPQGYSYVSTSTQVIDAINLTAQSLLDHNWPQAAALARALNTPLVLVRRDIVSPYQGRQIISPDDVKRALDASPNFAMIGSVGLLDLYGLRDSLIDPEANVNFVTINTGRPDLRLLSLLPSDAAVINHAPLYGVTNITQAPSLENWTADGAVFTWTPDAPIGPGYRIAELNSHTAVVLNGSKTFELGHSQARVTYKAGATTNLLRVSVTGRSSISNGDFTSGPWGPVGDCSAFDPTRAIPTLGALVIPNEAPGGLPAMRLSASYDSACVSHPIDWRGNPLIVSVAVKSVKGNRPRLCLLEVGPQRCAPLPTSSLLAGTGALELYLYADAKGPGDQTTVEYANVQVIEVPTLPSFYLLSDPPSESTASVELAIIHNTFSESWHASPRGQHVLVDGMLNGWLIPTGSTGFYAYYSPRDIFRDAQWVSTVALVMMIVGIVGWAISGLIRRRRFHLDNYRRAYSRIRQR